MDAITRPLKRIVGKLKGEEWRDGLDKEIEFSIEKVLKRIKPYEKNYMQAENPATAQLWVAVAELNAKIDAIDKKLERLLADYTPKRVKDEELRKSMENY